MVVVLAIISLSFGLCGGAFSQEQQAVDEIQSVLKRQGVEAYLLFMTLPWEEKQELIRLKQQDEQKFVETLKQRLPERKEEVLVFASLPPEVREQLWRLPESESKATQIRQRIDQRKAELAEIKAKDPQRYEEIVALAGASVREFAAKFVDGVKKQKNLRTYLVFETLPQKEQEGIIALRKQYQEALTTALTKKTAELEKLKEENPAEFQAVVEKALQQARVRIGNALKQHPEKAEQFKQDLLQKAQQNLSWLKEEDPQLYQEMMGKIEQKTEDALFQQADTLGLYDDAF